MNAAVGILALIAIPIVAIALFTLGFLGKRFPTRPLCRGCREPIGYEQLAESPAPCPRCGKLVADTGPPRFARTKARPFLLIGGALAIFASVGLVIAGAALSRSRQLAAANWAASLRTAQLVRLSTQASTPYDLNVVELRRRVKDGSLSPAELREAFLSTLDDLAAAGASQSQPGVQLVGGIVAEASPGDAEILATILERAFPAPAPQVTVLNGAVTISSPQSGPPPSPDALLVRRVILRGATVDGVPVALLEPSNRRPLADPILSGNRSVALEWPLDAGDHEIGWNLELVLSTGFDAQRHLDEQYQPLPRDAWPTPLATREERGSMTLRVPDLPSAPRGAEQPAGGGAANDR